MSNYPTGCRNTAVLSFHRCLINIVVEKNKQNFKIYIRILTTRGQCYKTIPW
jgi:hypothetical protein